MSDTRKDIAVRREFNAPQELVCSLILVIFCIVTVYSSVSARFLPFEKELIALIAFLPLLALAISGKIKGANHFFVLWAICVLVFSVGMISQDQVRFRRVLSSVVTITGLLLIPHLFSSTVNLFWRRRFRLLLFASLLAALISPWFPDQQDFGRFDPPNNFLIALSIVALVGFRGRRLLAARFLFFTAIFFLAFQSSWRFFPLAMLLLTVAVVIRRWPIGAILMVTGLIFLAVLGSQSYGAWIGSILSEVSPRFAHMATLSGFRDELGIRFLEVGDVLNHMREYGSVKTFLFGFGHGAEFFATSTIDAFGETARDSWKWRFSESSTAYTIHFGPMRVFFRYGTLGFVLFLLLSLVVIRRAWNAVPRRGVHDFEDIALATFCICVLLFLLQFFLQPTEHFPLFWLTLGAVLFSPWYRKA